MQHRLLPQDGTGPRLHLPLGRRAHLRMHQGSEPPLNEDTRLVLANAKQIYHAMP
ncbi:MAG: hypothetical protein J6T94_11445 [Bacteroidaceae bacterium]|nr:hypothetical protein [Bacteroidaceae bacterium]